MLPTIARISWWEPTFYQRGPKSQKKSSLKPFIIWSTLPPLSSTIPFLSTVYLFIYSFLNKWAILMMSSKSALGQEPFWMLWTQLGKKDKNACLPRVYILLEENIDNKNILSGTMKHAPSTSWTFMPPCLCTQCSLNFLYYHLTWRIKHKCLLLKKVFLLAAQQLCLHNHAIYPSFLALVIFYLLL